MKWWGEEDKRKEGGNENKNGGEGREKENRKDGEKSEKGGEKQRWGEESRGREMFCCNCWDAQKAHFLFLSFLNITPLSTHTATHPVLYTLKCQSITRTARRSLAFRLISAVRVDSLCVFFRAQTADQEADIRRLSTPSECLKKHISASDGCQPIQRLGRADTEVCEHTEVQPNARPEG